MRNPKQAIAIALREAGASSQESPARNRKNLKATKAKERPGETAKGTATTSPHKRLGGRMSKGGRTKTRTELYGEAKRRDVPGRSRMSKDELERALRR